MNKEEVRRLFPECVSFADECRSVFGDGVKLVYAKEGGREIGKRTEINPDRVIKLSDIVIGPVVDDGNVKRGR